MMTSWYDSFAERIDGNDVQTKTSIAIFDVRCGKRMCMKTKTKTYLTIAMTFCFALAAGSMMSACRNQRAGGGIAAPAGVYTLVSVDGKELPASISHEGATLRVGSGTFTINTNGTCSSKTIFVPASGAEVVREVSAVYTRDDSKLNMQWKGAGRTIGTIEGNTFTMNNEGMIFVYRK